MNATGKRAQNIYFPSPVKLKDNPAPDGTEASAAATPFRRTVKISRRVTQQRRHGRSAIRRPGKAVENHLAPGWVQLEDHAASLNRCACPGRHTARGRRAIEVS